MCTHARPTQIISIRIIKQTHIIVYAIFADLKMIQM